MAGKDGETYRGIFQGAQNTKEEGVIYHEFYWHLRLGSDQGAFCYPVNSRHCDRFCTLFINLFAKIKEKFVSAHLNVLTSKTIGS